MLEDKAQRLIELKIEFDRLKDEYINLRDEFHDELLRNNNKDFFFSGYKITVVEDSIRKSLDINLLMQNLRDKGLTEDDVLNLLHVSRKEIPLTGIIKIQKVD